MIHFDNHAFKGLDTSLSVLFRILQGMSADILSLLNALPHGLEAANPQAFAEAKLLDKKINEAEYEADKVAAEIITKFPITGEELRFVLASVKISGILEAAADKLKNCSKRLAKVQHPIHDGLKSEITIAIDMLLHMMPLTLEQVLADDDARAHAIIKKSDTVQHAYRRALQHVHALHAEHVADDTHFMLVIRNLEQVADLLLEIMKISHYIHHGTKYQKLES